VAPGRGAIEGERGAEDAGGGFAADLAGGEDGGVGLDVGGGEEAEGVEGGGGRRGAEDDDALRFGGGEVGEEGAGLVAPEDVDDFGHGHLELGGDLGDGARFVEEERHDIAEEGAAVGVLLGVGRGSGGGGGHGMLWNVRLSIEGTVRRVCAHSGVVWRAQTWRCAGGDGDGSPGGGSGWKNVAENGGGGFGGERLSLARGTGGECVPASAPHTPPRPRRASVTPPRCAGRGGAWRCGGEWGCVGGMMRLNVCDGPGSVCDLVGVRLRAVSGLDGEDGG